VVKNTTRFGFAQGGWFLSAGFFEDNFENNLEAYQKKLPYKIERLLQHFWPPKV